MSTEETRWNCKVCGNKFSDGDWWHEDGSKHVVAAKAYFLRDSGRVLITNIPPPVFPDNWQAGADDEGLGGVAIFLEGRFETSDPEQQYWLDLHSGICTEQEWREHQLSYMSPAERIEARERALEKREAGLASLRGDKQTCGNGK